MPEPTGRYGWTVPEGTDSPSGPEQFTELAGDIAATVGAIDDLVRTPAVSFTPTWVGLTLGNGTTPCSYRLLGSHLAVYIEVRAATSGTPTTAFVAGGCTGSMPGGFSAKGRAAGIMYWETGAEVRAGMAFVSNGSTTVEMRALRQTDVNYLAPATVWGMGVWPLSARFFASILIPI